jgi:hypothetical protein
MLDSTVLKAQRSALGAGRSDHGLCIAKHTNEWWAGVALLCQGRAVLRV